MDSHEILLAGIEKLQDPLPVGFGFLGPDSVGINRREVVNEKVIQERSSESILTPSM
jgi:hypothetical protein